MPSVLVVYHSETGHTRALAEAVAEGVRRVEGVDGRLKPVSEVSNDDLLAADGIVVGSPTYFGQMSAQVKQMFDASIEIYGQLQGKVGAAFTTAGGAGCGHEATNLSIITAMLVAGMVVSGHAEGRTPHFGAFAIGEPDERALASARHLGEATARLTQRLWA